MRNIYCMSCHQRGTKKNAESGSRTRHSCMLRHDGADGSRFWLIFLSSVHIKICWSSNGLAKTLLEKHFPFVTNVAGYRKQGSILGDKVYRRLDWVSEWESEWLTDWLTDRLTKWLTDWLTDRLTDWLKISLNLALLRKLAELTFTRSNSFQEHYWNTVSNTEAIFLPTVV